MILLFYLLNKEKPFYEAIGYFILKQTGFEFKIRQVKLKRSLMRLENHLDIDYGACKVTACVGVAELAMLTLIFMSSAMYIYMFLACVFIYLLPDLKVNEAAKQLEQDILNEMPHAILSIRLLLLSGMPSTKAIQEVKGHGPFVKIIKTSNEKILLGKNASKAYTELSYKYQMQTVTRYCRIMVLDEKNGSIDTITQLEKLCDDIWLQRKTESIKESEVASTKLLIPMMLSLIGVLIAVTFPAVIQLFTII